MGCRASSTAINPYTVDTVRRPPRALTSWRSTVPHIIIAMPSPGTTPCSPTRCPIPGGQSLSAIPWTVSDSTATKSERLETEGTIPAGFLNGWGVESCPHHSGEIPLTAGPASRLSLPSLQPC
eukprot:EG_transcript_24166